MDQMLFLAFTSFAEARPGAREAAKPFFSARIRPRGVRRTDDPNAGRKVAPQRLVDGASRYSFEDEGHFATRTLP
jgi:hypothetical protein